MKITVQTDVAAPIEQVWRAYTTPAEIKQWNAASDDWHTTAATVDLREGGAFFSRMEAKDGSMGFDFAGTYTRIIEHKLIAYAFGDRKAEVEFIPAPTASLFASPSTASRRTPWSSSRVDGKPSSTTSPVTSRRGRRKRMSEHDGAGGLWERWSRNRDRHTFRRVPGSRSTVEAIRSALTDRQAAEVTTERYPLI